ncbi:hypothetical protein [Crocosphaera sp.]|uniref:hypothetical protein n=1 Tax=Crocosphaera sp. TaxID=2729996 RepID=UPI003F28BEFF
MINTQNRLETIEKSIRETKEKLKEFEDKYELSSEEFIDNFSNDKLDHSLNMEFDEWMGEIWMLSKLEQKQKDLEAKINVD